MKLIRGAEAVLASRRAVQFEAAMARARYVNGLEQFLLVGSEAGTDLSCPTLENDPLVDATLFHNSIFLEASTTHCLEL